MIGAASQPGAFGYSSAFAEKVLLILTHELASWADLYRAERGLHC